jgi:hypothetical protein
MRRMRTAIACSLLAALLAGCGSGSAAKAVRDDRPTASEKMGGSPCLEGEEAQPWTFDMDTTTRGALFKAMKQGMVVV